MKSERQKKIEKHANMQRSQKHRKRLALIVSAFMLSIPVLIKYYFN